MIRSLTLAKALLLLAVPCGASAADPSAVNGVGPPSPERQAQLRYLLVQDCGSCHGLRLSGGLGPPLLSETLANKPVEFLVAVILHGQTGTAMPPWHPLLSPADAAWLAQTLKGDVP
jgi:cytochrome c55X